MNNYDEFQELEFKYKTDIGLKQFLEFMENRNYNRRLDISSWDTYYTKGDDFIRYRESHDSPELTIKNKTKKENNWHRVEVDLPLSKRRITKETVNKFTSMLGYSENFKIYKSCFIFWQEYINYVYYIVYDEEMVELDRFIEVEFNKDKLGHAYSFGPEQLVKQAEKELEVLGITSRNRLKKSIFEMYRK